jgi:hypothetical protein
MPVVFSKKSFRNPGGCQRNYKLHDTAFIDSLNQQAKKSAMKKTIPKFLLLFLISTFILSGGGGGGGGGGDAGARFRREQKTAHKAARQCLSRTP